MEAVAWLRRFSFDKATLLDYWILGKPRITLLVTLSCLIGFFMASPSFDASLACWSCLATAFVAFGASTLNQCMEQNVDAKMLRTSSRPLPQGRLSVYTSTIFGISVSLLGFGLFLWKVNVLAALLAASTLLSYLLVYTPLKRVSSLCTIVGAIPGALPPVIGWAAASGTLNKDAFVLFAILFLWQLPHFLAIAWLYEEDYRRADLPMLTVIDPSGSSAGQQLFLYSSALMPVALIPSMIGMTGHVYFYSVFLLGAVFLYLSLKLKVKRDRTSARHLLLTSVIYLPVVFLLMAMDRQ